MSPMANDNISWDILHMNLKQLGASNIESTPTKINKVDFTLDNGLTVSYLFNAKNEDKVFLQRIEPYPIQNIKLQNVDEVIEFIKRDVIRFNNASHSSNFTTFLSIVDKCYALRKDIEKFFLLYNVDKDLLSDIEKELDSILSDINKADRKKLSKLAKEIDFDDLMDIEDLKKY